MIIYRVITNILTETSVIMANCLPIPGLITHTRIVQSIYKRALRNLESFHRQRPAFRYQAVLLRDKFDKNSCIKDKQQIKQILEEAEKELFLFKHWNLRAHVYSPGGVAYEREVEPPDWVLDSWHPLEKAKYPEFFARREERKKEFIRQWKKSYKS